MILLNRNFLNNTLYNNITAGLDGDMLYELFPTEKSLSWKNDINDLQVYHVNLSYNI